MVYGKRKLAKCPWMFFAFFMTIILEGALCQNHSPCLRIMFYNTENLFDTFNDPAIDDDEYTPGSDLHWTNTRYRQKLNNIAKVIIATGEWGAPAVVGLCEVENFQVLMDLTTLTPLKNAGYQIIHENSPDQRGIDVAVLFRPEKMSLQSYKLIPVTDGSSWKTRDMLMCSFVTGTDTLTTITCHWPSRSGGQEFSAGRRATAASKLRETMDSIWRVKSNAKILLMGDFNDEPPDVSLNTILGAEKVNQKPPQSGLVNLSFTDLENGRGTLVHTEINKTWYLFDQIIVSESLFLHEGLSVSPFESMIFNPDWLLRNGRPFRTFQGPRYLGGFSDHLPIFIDLCIQH